MPIRYRPGHVLNVLEALYDLEQERSLWFAGALEALGTTFDQDAGVGMVLYNASGSVPIVEALDGFNTPAENLRIGAFTHAQPEWAERIVTTYRNDVCATLDEQLPDPEDRSAMRAFYKPAGISDQILINGANPSGIGCAAYLFSRGSFRLRASERRLLTRLANHIAAAYRLHRRLANSPTVEPEVVLRPDGRLEHVAPAAHAKAALSNLQDAVSLREWSRRHSHDNTDQALAAWPSVVAGEWSLVDIGTPGRRYIAAHRNAATWTGIHGLSPREREVADMAARGSSNKVIAHELGIAHSTVRVLLARAALKLGARTRAELIAELRPPGVALES